MTEKSSAHPPSPLAPLPLIKKGFTNKTNGRLCVLLAVDMWRPLGCADCQRFALVWETEELQALNNTLFSFVKSKVRLCMH